MNVAYDLLTRFMDGESLYASVRHDELLQVTQECEFTLLNVFYEKILDIPSKVTLRKGTLGLFTDGGSAQYPMVCFTLLLTDRTVEYLHEEFYQFLHFGIVHLDGEVNVHYLKRV